LTLPIAADWVDTREVSGAGRATFGSAEGAVVVDLGRGVILGAAVDRGTGAGSGAGSGSGTGTGTGTWERERGLPGIVGDVCAIAVEGELVAAVVEVAGEEHQVVTGRRDGQLARIGNATHESVAATCAGIAAVATGRPPALHLVRAHEGTASRVTVALPNLGDSRVHALFFHDGHAWVLVGRTLVAIDLAALPSHVGNASIAAEYRPFTPEGPGPLEAPAIEVVTLL
jgi:hypothetical protein